MVQEFLQGIKNYKSREVRICVVLRPCYIS